MIYHSYTDSLNTAYIENVARRCSGIAPSFFVTGNHERFWADEVKKLFSKQGCRAPWKCDSPYRRDNFP